ncbi:MAG: phosphate ABC transporter permease subunit PstC [Oscillospiraceae bacterium]|nr:phosphate ABC transporter permease subunit PstC [Oscillospiraceae bacterium]
MQKFKETAMKFVFAAAACISIIFVVLICYFLFSGGLPAIGKIGVGEFLLGKQWKPANQLFGIFPMIIGSIYVTAGALLVGVPLGVLTAVYLAKFCPKPLYKALNPAISLMAGIPSVIYGFFGLVVMVPFVRNILGVGSGKSMLTASLLLGIMILPTIIRVSESAIKAVPKSYYEGALALGATPERGMFFTVLPAAKSGVTAGVILGLGRAVGETMAVIMVAGNQAMLPESLADGVRTLTANVVLEMGYAEGLHREALIATAAVLFVFILIINLLLSLVKRRQKT